MYYANELTNSIGNEFNLSYSFIHHIWHNTHIYSWHLYLLKVSALSTFVLYIPKSYFPLRRSTWTAHTALHRATSSRRNTLSSSPRALASRRSPRSSRVSCTATGRRVTPVPSAASPGPARYPPPWWSLERWWIWRKSQNNLYHFGALEIVEEFILRLYTFHIWFFSFIIP